MKLKKTLALFAILTVMLFALTGCSDSEPVEFDYDESTLLQSVESTLTTMIGYSDAEALYYENTADAVYAQGVKGCQSAVEECGQFVEFESYKLTEKGDSIEILINAKYENREVEFQCMIEENPAAAYDPNAAQLQFSDITVSPEYTFAEKMIKAASNTLMGMGTVFVVLIFISFIINFFKFIPLLTEKKAKKKADASKEAANAAVKKAPVAPAAAPASSANLMDDAQLVAVITAAINAYEGSNSNNATSKDTLVVRSIRRARR